MSSTPRWLLHGLVPLLVASCAAPRVAASGPSLRAAEREPVAPPGEGADLAPGTDTDRAAGILWRFHAGSALAAPPAVGLDGTLFVGTSEGAFQAVRPDGTLAWSYTLTGAVGASPVVATDGRVFVATTAQRIYAFTPGGQRSWLYRAPVGITTDFVLTARPSLLFGGAERSLWAISPSAAALYRVAALDVISAGPAVAGDSAILGTAEGHVVVTDGPAPRYRIALGARVRRAVLRDDGSAAVVAGDQLYRLDARGRVEATEPGVEWIARGAAGGLITVTTSGVASVLGRDGSRRWSQSIPGSVGAPPVEDSAGLVYVPTDAGDLFVVAAEVAPRRIPIARSALRAPVLDPSRRRVVIAAGEGVVAVIDPARFR